MSEKIDFHLLPETEIDTIKDALVDKLEEYRESGKLPEIMKIHDVSIEQGTMSIEVGNSFGKIVDVKMDIKTHKISDVKFT